MGKETAGPSTTLRSGRDDNSVGPLTTIRLSVWTWKCQRSDTGEVSDLSKTARKLLLRVVSPGYVSGMAYLG